MAEGKIFVTRPILDAITGRTAAKGDVLLLTGPVCPIVLVEGGFLSNPQECQKLKTGEYQEKLALAVWEGINELWGLEKAAPVPVVESANKTA